MPFIYSPRKNRRGFGGLSQVNTSSRGTGLGSSYRPGRGRYGFAGISGTPAAAPAMMTSRERGAPERFEADVMGLVQTAAQAPGHALERPLAIANQVGRLASGAAPGEKGPIDHILQGIGDLGFGEGADLEALIGATGEAIMHVGNAPMALINSGDARVLARIDELGLSDDDVLNPGVLGMPVVKKIDGPPILGLLGIGGRDMTVGEFKEELARRGWNQQVDPETGEAVELPWEQVIAKAREDAFGFGDKAINDSIFVDLAGRIAMDPFNLLLGAGVVGKAGRLVNWATRSQLGQVSAAAGSRIRSAYGVGYLQDMATLGIRAARKPSEAIAARAITAGRMESATLRGLGAVLAAPRTLLLPGTGSLGRRYARGALRTELGLLGAETVAGVVDAGATSIFGEDNVVSGFMEPLHDASQAFLADKPMSADITFMLASAFAMPAVPLIREDAGALRGAARETFGDQDLYLWGRAFGAEPTGISGRADPLGRRRGKAREAELLNRLGGKVEFARLIDHIDMRIAFDRMKQYTPIIKHFESFDEAMARSRAIGHVVAAEARRLRETGQIKAQDRIDSFTAWGRAHSRTVVDRKGNLIKEVPQRVDFELSPDELVAQWIRYRDVHAELAKRFAPVGEAILGRANRLTKEDLSVIRSAVASASSNGRIDAAYVRDLLSQTPAMFEDASLSPDQREFWLRLMNLGVGAVENGQGTGRRRPSTLDASELDAQLRALENNAPPARELYHEAAASERRAPKSPTHNAGAVRAGKLRRIYSQKKLRDLRVSSNGQIRSLTKEIDSGSLAMERKWTSRGNLRLRRAKPVRATKPEASPNSAIPELQNVARTFNEVSGLPELRQGEYWAFDSDFARRTGLAYEAMETVGNDAATRMAYEAFERETLAQYRALQEAGYVMEPWTQEGQPYQNSREMQADVRDNKHLYFFTGGEPHPFLGKPLAQYGGLSANDIFRAVHDIITHATEGYQFGARGEVNAAIKHSQMFTPIARRAMLSETHGQNSWTNYGPHNPQKLAAADRPYADQKSALLPDEIIYEFESRYLGETHAVASRKAREIAESLGLTGEQANAAAAILEARARAWASNNPGKSAADYMRRIAFEKGGDVSEAALLQRAVDEFDTVAVEDYGFVSGSRQPNSTPNLDRAFEVVPILSEPATFFRSISRERAVALTEQAGGSVDWPGYMSTATTRELARPYQPEGAPIIRVEVPQGVRVLDMDSTVDWPGAMPWRKRAREEGGFTTGEKLLEKDLTYDVRLEGDEIVLTARANQVDTATDTGVSGSTSIDVSALPGRDRGTLEPLLDQPAPQALIDAGLGEASPLEWIKLSNGEDFAIPGGLEGTFSLWDAWRLKAQQVDPNLIPTDTRIRLYAKLFESQARELSNPLDAWNRIAFAHMSPAMVLLKNEAAGAVLRIRSIDELREFAEAADPNAVYERIAGAGAAGKTTGPQLRSLQVNARRFLEHPDWFTLRDGEDLIQYSERIMSVLDGAGMKVGNFSAMLGDPLGHNRGTIDSHMVEILTREGYLPEDVAARLNGEAPAAKAVALTIRGKDNPNVPEHLRDLPWIRKDGKVMTFDGDYRAASEALDRYLQDQYPNLPFHSGGGQWFLWDMERGIIEPHTVIWPGSDKLPAMSPEAIKAATQVAGDAGYYRARGRQEPYDPAEAVFYQSGQSRVKGATEFVEDGTVIIRGLASPDISTFVHEVGHVFRRDLVDEDLALAESHYGIADGTWTREAEEAFARDFERWTRTGKAQVAGLEQVFAKLYEWMRQVYRSVLRKDVDAKMGAVFTRLFEEPRAPADIPGFVEGFGRIRANMDYAARATGEVNTVAIVRDQVIGETRMVTLAKFGDDGKAVSTLNIVFDPATGLAAKDGLYIDTVREGRGQGHATELYEFAEAQGWEVEQASARSENLTEAGRAFQKARWAKQRAAEAGELEAKRQQVRQLRTEVREINKRAEEIRTVRIDPSFLDENGNPTVEPASLEALREQTAFVQDNFPRQYGVERAPKVSYARYQPDDSHLAALLTERSNLAQILFDYGPIAKMTQFIGHITAPVRSSQMAHDGRQQVFNLLLPLKAKTDEVAKFLEELRDEQNKGYSTGKLHQPFFRGITALPPNRIQTIAREVFGSNEGFLKAFEQKYGGIDRMHVMLDEAHNSLIRRVDQRVMRGQRTGVLERVFRSGYWAWQHVPGLRTASDITRMASKVYYPLFRFQMDLRWQTLNVIEADTLAFFRDGLDGTRFSRAQDQVVRRGGRDVNLTQNAVEFHGDRSGMPQVGKKGAGSEAAYEDTGVFLTNQNLAPVLKRSFQKQSLENVDQVLNDLADSDPILRLLQRKYGPEQGTWAQQLNETLYSFDRRGVRKTIDETVRKVRKYEKWSQAEYDQMVPFINKLIERNQQTFNDLTQIHIGNIDRSQLERVMNSFWLYWPISYQIKATKWMVGVLTQRSFGQATNLGGAFTLDRAAQIVREQVASNPEFQQQMEDNEDWWFVASMLLPIAPWDYGMSLNRHVRYVGGNVLGLWPEYAGLDDPGDYARKTLELGPVYTIDLLARFFEEQTPPATNAP